MFGLVLPYIHCGSILKAPVAFTHPSGVGGQGPAAVLPPSQCGRTPPPQRTPPNAPPSTTSPATCFSPGPRPSHRIRTTRLHDRRGTVARSGGLGAGRCSVKDANEGKYCHCLYIICCYVYYIYHIILLLSYKPYDMIYYMVIWYIYATSLPWGIFWSNSVALRSHPSPGWRDVEWFTPFRSSRRDMVQQLHSV